MSQSDQDHSQELNSYHSFGNVVFGGNFLSRYNLREVTEYVKDPMHNHAEIQELSWMAYNSSGIVTRTIDYMRSIPTLDRVIIKRGTDSAKLEQNKQRMISVLNAIKHREFIRDCLFTDMVEGQAVYYCEVSHSTRKRFPKTMSDFDVAQVSEVNQSAMEEGYKISLKALPYGYYKIVGMVNSSYVVAFDLSYFDLADGETTKRKLLKYPKEIRDAYNQRSKSTTTHNWIVLDNRKTIVHKIRSKQSEPWGRPLVLAALNNILYHDYFKETKRNLLHELNHRIYYQTFPEGKEKGTSALTGTQQATQHATVRDAIQNKNAHTGTSFFSVPGGTKIDALKVDTDIFDEKNEATLSEEIATDLGFGLSLLNGSSGGTYSSQQNNMELIAAEIFEWIEGIASELNKVINANIIKDPQNRVEVYYLPTSLVNRDKFFGYMKELYTTAKGSLQALIAASGFSVDSYLALLDEELEAGYEDKYPCHATSYTMSKDIQGGRPVSENPTNESTLKTQSNGGNGMPKPSVK